MTAPALDIERLEVVFHTARQDLFAVREVSLRVEPGEVVGLVGESGSGKSVTARALLRIVDRQARVTGGHITLNVEGKRTEISELAPNGREIRWETTVAEEKASNIHVAGGVTREEFVKMRTARDATLGMPQLIIPSLQVNMKAGALPQPDESGKRFLKVPLNTL